MYIFIYKRATEYSNPGRKAQKPRSQKAKTHKCQKQTTTSSMNANPHSIAMHHLWH